MTRLFPSLFAVALLSTPALALADVAPEPSEKDDDKDCSIGGPQNGLLAFGFVVLILAGTRLRGRD